MFTPILLFLCPIVFELGAHMGQTDGRTDRQAGPVMQPIGMAAQ